MDNLKKILVGSVVSMAGSVPLFAQYSSVTVQQAPYEVQYGPTVLLIAAGILAGIKCSYISNVTGEGAGCLGWGIYTFLYLIGMAIPLLPLIWIIWPNLLLNTERTPKEGADVDQVKREYRRYIRFYLGIGYAIAVGIFVASLPWQFILRK